MRELVIGTTNPGKLDEMRRSLADLPFMVTSLADFSDLPIVNETGATFAENAALKASAYARSTSRWVLADDSGLEVPFLNGMPGVRSARFAGENASDAENTEKLLRKLATAAGDQRKACFVCEMAVSDETGRVFLTASGRCPGSISRNPRGTNGFGYDPVFVPEGQDLTFGELPERFKLRVSHRSDAARKIIELLRLQTGPLLDR